MASARPTADDRQALAWLQEHHERDLTAWEIGFLENNADRASWSLTVCEIFDGIWERCAGRASSGGRDD